MSVETAAKAEAMATGWEARWARAPAILPLAKWPALVQKLWRSGLGDATTDRYT